MARIKLAYIGGGSTRAPGTMASLIAQGDNFTGSEIVLVDLDQDRLQLVKQISERMIASHGLDLKVTATSDRCAALADCDAVLSSFRPGGFEARMLDERIPLNHGVIGQETQGPGGFFMALRSIAVLKEIVQEMADICPRAWLVNYTNPVNIVAEAITHHSDIRMVSLCEGPIIFSRGLAKTAGLDPERLDATMIGLNHACWSTRHLYDGEDVMPLLEDAWHRLRHDPAVDPKRLRMLHLAVTMQSIPADYFQYYYFMEEVLAELTAKPTTRAQDILASVPDYWEHYRAEAESMSPELDPQRSRGGVHELELAIDVMDALFNDRGEVWPVNVPNRGAIADFPDDRVVEVPGYVDRHGIVPLQQGHMPPQVAGLVKQLGEYQSLAATAAWDGGRREAIQALASNPLVMSLAKAEVLFDEMAAAHRAYLPERFFR